MTRHAPRDILLSAVCLFAWLPAAHAASIDCAKARTGVEKAVCADPQLSEYDERIAAAYKTALAAWDGAIRGYVRSDQRRWLSEIRRIDSNDSEIDPVCDPGDLPCLRREYQRRMDEIESAGYRNSGVYERSDGGGNLVVRAIRNADISLRLYDRTRAKIVGTAHDDAQTVRTGLPHLQRDTFRWNGMDTLLLEAADATGQPPSDGCALTVRFSERAAIVLQEGGCDGARLAGTYLRDLDASPIDHELSPE